MSGLRKYEITFEAPNGDWHWYYIHVKDFHAAIENTIQSLKTFPGTDHEGWRIASVREESVTVHTT